MKRACSRSFNRAITSSRTLTGCSFRISTASSESITLIYCAISLEVKCFKNFLRSSVSRVEMISAAIFVSINNTIYFASSVVNSIKMLVISAGKSSSSFTKISSFAWFSINKRMSSMNSLVSSNGRWFGLTSSMMWGILDETAQISKNRSIKRLGSHYLSIKSLIRWTRLRLVVRHVYSAKDVPVIARLWGHYAKSCGVG